MRAVKNKRRKFSFYHKHFFYLIFDLVQLNLKIKKSIGHLPKSLHN